MWVRKLQIQDYTCISQVHGLKCPSRTYTGPSRGHQRADRWCQAISRHTVEQKVRYVYFHLCSGHHRFRITFMDLMTSFKMADQRSWNLVALRMLIDWLTISIVWLIDIAHIPTKIHWIWLIICPSKPTHSGSAVILIYTSNDSTNLVAMVSVFCHQLLCCYFEIPSLFFVDRIQHGFPIAILLKCKIICTQRRIWSIPVVVLFMWWFCSVMIVCFSMLHK